jgi:hypothetical protein
LQPSIVQPRALYLAAFCPTSFPSTSPTSAAMEMAPRSPCIPDSGISGVIRHATTASHPGPNAAPSQHPQEVSPAENRCRTARAAGVAQQAQVATAVVQWLKTPPVLGALSLIPISIRLISMTLATVASLNAPRLPLSGWIKAAWCRFRGCQSGRSRGNAGGMEDNGTQGA